MSDVRLVNRQGEDLLGPQPASNSIPVTGTFVVSLVENTAINSGTKTVAVAGTAEPIVAVSTPMNQVQIQALTTNTDLVFVGDSSVSSSNPGAALYPGDSVDFSIDDLDTLYVDSVVNGEGISFNRLS